jgi:hypothetical protein
MFDNAGLLDQLERALDHDPFCPICGAPTTVEDDDNGRLWLVCSATMMPATLIGRLSAAILPHERRFIVDPSEGLAAA